MARLWIGCSGWNYRGWVGRYYPARTPSEAMFERYAADFAAVEINNTFYRMPTAETIAHWAEQAPEGFLYAVKAHRFITHNKKLLEPEATFLPFLERVSGLGAHLGPILIQLPPSWRYNGDRLRAFVDTLPEGPRYGFEFRHASWLNPEALALLRSRNMATCIYDIGGVQSPLTITADWVYVRLHGPDARAYHGSYAPEALGAWAERIAEWAGAGLDVYCFFDNDVNAAAPADAKALQALVEGKRLVEAPRRGLERSR